MEYEDVNAVDRRGQPPRKNDPYSQTYNSGWAKHPNFAMGGPRRRSTADNETRPCNLLRFENFESTAQCNYTIAEKEILAVVFAVEKFRSYSEPRS